MADQTNQTVGALQAIIDDERKKRESAERMAQAVIEEFSNCHDFDDFRDTFRKQLKVFAPDALINIITMAADINVSDSTRAGLNKWIVEWAMSDKIDGSGSELKDLLTTLKKSPTPTTT